MDDGLLTAAAVLHANGNETEDSITAVKRAGAALGHPLTPEFTWDTAALRPVESIKATPLSINMARVEATTQAIDDLENQRVTPEGFADRVRQARDLPAAGTLLFTLAAVVGAGGLAVIFGIRHWPALLAVCAAAGLGALLRRGLGRYGAGAVAQAFAAALLAGVIGAIAVRLNLSSDLRLVVVCPCMVLVPGPHLLNGALDLAAMRLRLGTTRLIYAGLILLGISAGLLIGLALGGESLPATAPGREISWWLDALAAGVVAPCYLIFYSARLRIAAWSAAVGALVHAVRWYALTVWHVNLAIGAGIACLLAGVLLIPVARRYRVPFAAVGFAAVVCLIPGVYVFRAASALAQLAFAKGDAAALLVTGAQDAATAVVILLAMVIGLLLPITAWRLINNRKGAS
ncbi:uncharacterized membrane protein YjjP (DUF1212 family) [Actinoplanes lutulentus]|uniref:Uncharacterized membrane protein YjjP (DUF1212 family) n=1 Tax=Actinoplanes lutulentus TaxID=1287878 RepID=A0A327Z3Z3_9ACTN|nr:threonine/serine exporter family protein [Actinoplanes lutulentus]MBB2947785.1 uncharacterized membrane protein YjjP (DUF1212 family) [Actinoplanes lutulentus]RAK29901.1 uncharacterized membrane protein YjjP (DUF1212 family) [Actinoplanes lutulentus]